MFNDDEQPIAPSSSAGKKVGGVSDVGRASVKPYYPKEALPGATTVRVLLDVSSSSSTAERRLALDLVVVLDVSGSMGGYGRLEKLQSAMRFIIKKLTPMDRLSVVTFNSEANRLCPLRAVSEDAVRGLTDMVDRLRAGGGTKIVVGLDMGLKVLAGRRFTGGRTTAVILMSDGEDSGAKASDVVNPQNFPVYTLSLGPSADTNLLQQLAMGGGTYNHAQDSGVLSMLDVFSQLMGGLLTVVVQDLQLILSKPAYVEIAKVDPGDFEQDPDAPSGTVTVKFVDLFSGEGRKVIVELSLGATESSDYDVDILDVKVSYSDPGEQGKWRKLSPDEQGTRKTLEGVTLHVKRTSTASGGGTTPELEAELLRREHASSIKEARLLANERKLAAARARLVKGQRELEEGVLAKTNPMVAAALRTELQTLMECMRSEDEYLTKGKPYALAVELSHARQRFAAKGVDDGVSLFATPRMKAYLEQARLFAVDPDAPLPTADEDADAEVANTHPPTPDKDADAEVANAPLPTAAGAGAGDPNAPPPAANVEDAPGISSNASGNV